METERLSEQYSSYSKVDTQGGSDELQIKAAFLFTDNKRSLEWWAQKNLHYRHLQSGTMRLFHSSKFPAVLEECTHLKGIDGFCEVHSKTSSKEYFFFFSCVLSNFQGWGKGVESSVIRWDSKQPFLSLLFSASLASMGRKKSQNCSIAESSGNWEEHFKSSFMVKSLKINLQYFWRMCSNHWFICTYQLLYLFLKTNRPQRLKIIMANHSLSYSDILYKPSNNNKITVDGLWSLTLHFVERSLEIQFFVYMFQDFFST